MTFHGTDYAALLQQRATGVLLLEYLAHAFGTDDPTTIDTAGTLGALDAELVRREAIAQRIVGMAWGEVA